MMSKDAHSLIHALFFSTSERLHIPFLPPGTPFSLFSRWMKSHPNFKAITVASSTEFFPPQLNGLPPSERRLGASTSLESAVMEHFF